MSMVADGSTRRHGVPRWGTAGGVVRVVIEEIDFPDGQPVPLAWRPVVGFEAAGRAVASIRGRHVRNAAGEVVNSLSVAAVSPFLEMGAYEALWLDTPASFKRVAEALHGGQLLPTAVVPRSRARAVATEVRARLAAEGAERFGVRVRGTSDYPPGLNDAQYPLAVVYYQGNWELAFTRAVAVVGTRAPSPEGLARTRRLVRSLVEDGFTVVSGLARGIDTEAHETAIKSGGRTIAVLGTPVSHHYPPENAALQERIAAEFLVVSQVPVLRYLRQGPKGNRIFFPERNVTMSALTEATVIVEAGETSGTLVQARAALKQGRKLFILESCFTRPELTWPRRFEEQGAVRVHSYDQIQEALSVPTPAD